MIQELELEVRRRFGLLPRSGWQLKMTRLVDECCAEQRLVPSEVGKRLLEDRAMLRQLAGRMTVAESYFLRNREDLVVIDEHLRLKLSQGPEPARVWSAGCARGEEPYSVAMVIREMSGPEAASRVEIIASDINGDAIAAARQGVFRAWSLRGMPAQTLQRYFQPCGEGEWSLSEEIVRSVHFENLSAQEHLARLPAGSIDVVLFRNVAVYLDQGALERLYRGFARVLAPDGALILAATDPRPSGALLEPEPRDRVVVYRPLGLEPAGRSPDADRAGAPSQTGTSRDRARPPARLEAAARETRPDQPTIESAYQLADRGRTQEALDLTARVIDSAPAHAEAFRLRGLLLMTLERFDDAAETFRRALLLEPEAHLCRYWSVLALDLAGRPAAALRELRSLSRRLEVLKVDSVLEDDETTCGELRQAIETTRRALL